MLKTEVRKTLDLAQALAAPTDYIPAQQLPLDINGRMADSIPPLSIE